MDHFDVQKNATMARDEKRGFALISDQKDLVVCPKPRRVGILANTAIRSSRWNVGHQTDGSDLKAGAELLDIILMREGYGAARSVIQVSSSPPYFCGSPPSRAANPLIHDARFGDEKISSFLALPGSPTPNVSSNSSSTRKGGCSRMKFGPKPATVRVEGFDCLNRDRQNSSIPAFA